MAYMTRREMDSAYNNSVAQAEDEAHERRMRRRAKFIESNPNAVSPWENASTLGRRRRLEDDAALREQELKMLQQQGANAVAMEAERGKGLRWNAYEATNAKAEADKYTADRQAESALRKAEIDAAGNAARWGRFREDGTYVPGSEVAVGKGAAEVEKYKADRQKEASIYAADAGVDVQAEKNRGLMAQNQMERDLKSFEQQHAKELLQMKLTGAQPNRQELALMMQELSKQENKGKTPGEILMEIRGRVGAM